MNRSLPLPKFPIETPVYLKVDTEGGAGTVTGLLIRPHGLVYMVTWADGEERQHYEFELTQEKSYT